MQLILNMKKEPPDLGGSHDQKGGRYEILVDADYIGHGITCGAVVCLITIGIKHITISSGIEYHILSRSRF